MTELISKTGERILPENFESKEEYLLWLRHLFAYDFAKDEISKNSFVLDVGCGEGYGTSLLSQCVMKIIGLDVDENITKHVSKKYGQENCVFRLYDGVKIPYEDDTFDVVVCFQVIEHVQDDANLVSEVHRVLKRSGVFILTTPNRSYRLMPGQKPWNKFHVREYYHHQLENVLRNRFSDVKVWGIHGNEEVQRIEIERVRQDKAMGIVAFAPSSLRKLIPQPLKAIIVKVLRGIIRKKRKSEKDDHFREKYSLMDYYVTENNLRDSLDLLGICKK